MEEERGQRWWMVKFAQHLNGMWESICHASGAPTPGESIYADYTSWKPSWLEVPSANEWAAAGLADRYGPEPRTRR